MNTIPPTQAVVPDLWITFVKSGATLCIVLGVLVLLLFVMKRFLQHNKIHVKQDLLKVLSSHYIAPKEKIMLVEVLGEKILIGVTPQNINFISKIRGKESQNVLNEDKPGGLFSNLLKGTINRKKNSDDKEKADCHDGLQVVPSLVRPDSVEV